MKFTYNDYSKYIIGLLVLVIIVLGFFYIVDLRSGKNRLMEAQQAGVPGFMISAFPETQWQKRDPSILTAISTESLRGEGVTLSNPKFVPISQSTISDKVEAIVIKTPDNRAKVYPFNILAWHGVINDVTPDGKPIAVTFCTLCGSAVVYDRTMSNGKVAVMGVSGALVQSNLTMFDSLTESIWQQSTGEAIAGEYYGDTLQLVSYQLHTMAEVRDELPEALVLDSNTGFDFDYDKTPFSGYDEGNAFIYNSDPNQAKYPGRDVFVAFRVKGKPASFQWRQISALNNVSYSLQVHGESIAIERGDHDLVIKDTQGNELPFYYEMWFSWSRQNKNDGVLLDLLGAAVQ